MAASLRRFSRSLFIFLNLAVAGLLLLSCANAYLDPWRWWLVALLGFAFLPLFIVNAFFLLYWIFRKSKWAILSLIVLLLSWMNFRAAVGLNFNSSPGQSNANSIRILTWNVHMFSDFDTVRHKKNVRAEMIQFITEQNADILCLQEFYDDYARERRKGSAFDLLAQVGYKYAVYAEDYGKHPDRFSMGTAIFSRFPIVDSLRLRYKDQPGPVGRESLISIDIQKNGKMFRVFSTHLQSYQFGEEDYENIQKIKDVKNQTYEASKSVARKLRLAYKNRVGQARMVRTQLDNSRIPEILTGDFNDIPNSYTYFHIKGDRQDAFVEKSWGIGRTFAAISPTLRIDFVIADKSFKILRYEKKNVPYSDHYPIIVDLELP